MLYLHIPTTYSPLEIKYKNNGNDPLDILWEVDVVKKENQDLEV